MNKKPNLLIVEDDVLSLRIYKMCLSQHFNVTITDSVKEFYKMINSNIKFDVIFIDILLCDEKDGFDLTRELRASEKYKHCPILAITGNDISIDKLKAHDAGITTFMRKPIEHGVLLKELTSAVNFKVN